ncbi:DUF6986 family protein [Streptomyces sp. 4N509B]|uniref:DUF6986 family protein n=1 Tax=Streptomyces sp. 4N509B TaxID=3457413 RepID=UPI003FD1F2A4
MRRRDTAHTSLSEAATAAVTAPLAAVDAELARRYPGAPPASQPVHTVYVPADRLTADTVRSWGEAALALLDAHAPDAAALATLLGLPDALAAPVHDRVRAKLAREPVEDLRIDFEDGYGRRPDAEEDAAAVHAARVAVRLAADPGGPAHLGIRMKSMEAPVRDRAVRTLDVFLTTLLDAGPPPKGLRLTLPKVSHPAQVTAMSGLCGAFERATGLTPGQLRFEAQIETTQAILGPDGRATVARLVDAAEGRLTGLHFGTYDYTAACQIPAAHQSLDHPAADHAKAVMQLAAAGTGVELSDGSTNVLPTGSAEQVHHAWRLHHRLVRRGLARGFPQGWDLHPGQLPTRYTAVYAFYREGFDAAADRLATYVGRLATPGTAVLDEPATARALAAFLLRGLRCGALDAAELAAGTGLAPAELAALADPATPHPPRADWTARPTRDQAS